MAGWIEIQDHLDNKWFGAVKINPSLVLVDRNYAMNDFLFAVRNKYENALAPKRGLPRDAAEETKQFSASDYGHSHSWITWEELSEIKWSERTKPDGQDGTYQEVYTSIDQDTEVILSSGWSLISDLMRTLASYHGANRVRLVVWFG